MKHTTTTLATFAAAIILAAGSAAAQNTPVVLTDPGFKPQLEEGAVDVPRGSILIQDLDSVWTATGRVLTGTDILIRDGVIREIGPDLNAPRGVKTVEGAGFTAIPGFVDPHSHIAMTTSNECTSAIVPEVRVIDQLDPQQYGVFRALIGGVTTAHVMHGSCNPIGGQSAIIKPRWGLTDPYQFMIQGAPQIVKFALGENVTRKNRGGDGVRRYPFSRQGVEGIYVQAFNAARAYEEVWERYRENRRDFRVPPRRDLRLEALVDILNGRIRVQAHSYRADETLMLMDVAERFGFTIDGFVHILEGYKVADEVARHGAYATTFSDWWQYKLEAFDAIPYNAAILHEHGVHTSLNSDSERLQVFALYEIQKPVRYGGMAREEALRMYTRYPAEQMLIGDKVGSIAEGMHGDIVLLSGDPFDSNSRVEKTIMDGIVYWDRTAEAEYRRAPMRTLETGVTRTVAATVPWATARSLEDEGDLFAGPRDADHNTGATADETADDVYALVGATVHPVTGPAIEDGAVVVRNGRIEAVGPTSEVSIPADARRVPVEGHLFPGMTDLSTGLGLLEIGSVATATDQRETGEFNPHLRAMIGLQPHSTTYGVARMNGITTALTHQQAGTIPGAGSLIQLKGDTPHRLSIQDRAAMVINFPRPSGNAWDDPELEGDDLEALVDLFERTLLFMERPTTRDDPDMPFEAQVHGGERLMLESLVPVVTGEMPAFFRVSSERDIRTLLLFLDEFPDVRPVIIGGAEAHRVADELGERGIPVALNTGNSPTGDRDDPHDAAWVNAGVLHEAGVPVAFTTTDVSNVRNLPHYAARHRAYGLPHDVAVRAVTLTPAEILGLGAEMGSISPGKRADLILTDGDLLQLTTAVQRMWIGGEEVDPRDNKHDRLYEDFRDRH
ncbi:MAG: amidohydrolase family protein [Longimicrobiales bacterium]